MSLCDGAVCHLFEGAQICNVWLHIVTTIYSQQLGLTQDSTRLQDALDWF